MLISVIRRHPAHFAAVVKGKRENEASKRDAYVFRPQRGGRGTEGIAAITMKRLRRAMH
jgi:hypothetical protein